MKKRTAVILITALLLFVFGGTAVFAAASSSSTGNTFSLKSSTPADGYKRMQAQNVMIKLNFSSDIDSSEAKKINKDKFTFEDSNGKPVDYKIYYDKEDGKKISLLAEKKLKENKAYTVTIDGELTDNSGATLGKDQTIKFETKKSGGGIVYFLLMAAMIVVMMFMTFREQRKQKEEEIVESGKPDAKAPKNPYKLAKEKGISVQEAQKIIDKERAKEQKKIDKRQKKEAKLEQKVKTEIEEEYQIFKVHTRRLAHKKIKR